MQNATGAHRCRRGPIELQGYKMFQRKIRGFTLIEMLIVIAIIAIIAAIALPSYNRYVEKSRRADGREVLMRVAAAQERFYTNRNSYAATLADLSAGAASEGGYYTVGIALGAGDQTYTLTGTPAGPQVNDKCLNLTLTNAGIKGHSGDESNGDCW